MLALHPPEYLPPLATLALYDRAERVVLADTARYSRQSFQNRARLRGVPGGQWATIPLAPHQRGLPLCRAQPDHHARWQAQHARAFEYNYRSAPYFEFYEDDFAPLFSEAWPSLGVVNAWTTRLLMRLVGITTPLAVASEDGECPPPDEPHALADLARRYDANALLVPEAAARRLGAALPGVAVTPLRFAEAERAQNFDGFAAGCSAVDALFNHGPETLRLLRAGMAEGGDG